MKKQHERNVGKQCIIGLLVLVSLLLSSCSVPGIVATNAQLPAVKTTPQAVTLSPVRFPQDEAAHRDLTEWWYYTGHMSAVITGGMLMNYGLACFSYYYSRTRMALSGVLVDHNLPLQVSGEAWMDHQWGNFLALGGGGWDWFSIQLDNDTEMMIYLIRDATGKTISTYIGYIGSNAGDHLLPASAVHVDVLGHWKSPATGATYPSGWHLEINDPQLQASLTLTPE